MSTDTVIIRMARAADADALGRLAALDSAAPLRGDVLVAQVGGELWAALSVLDDRAVADPFRRSGELVALLATRARQLRGEAGDARTRRGLRALLRAAALLSPSG
ncbi:MAG TPA: hypothetical protein VHB30_06355 [Solirubrobacteraceae bacterium]|jgi:hypothetical protein|nr:hypothetical protein [Solirubrobacteraceae bacterium]